ncbi:MAG: hypothetical protein IGQ88_02510 [Gloeomargaritaceae cyanobacterium C42_A2020_066]|nr:hypothetical protein [Gloeomargaritaceae cyanobacterium C42_A2020_066]
MKSLVTPPSLSARPRRLRQSSRIRRLVRETTLELYDLIYPVFVMEGEGERQPISTLPGCWRYTLDNLLIELEAAAQLGILGIALFPVIPADQKDPAGRECLIPVSSAS